MLHFLLHQFHNEVKKIYKLDTESLLHKLCSRFCCFKEIKYAIFISRYHNNLLYIQDSFFTAGCSKSSKEFTVLIIYCENEEQKI